MDGLEIRGEEGGIFIMVEIRKEYARRMLKMEKRREGSWMFEGRHADGWWDGGGQVETDEPLWRPLKAAAKIKNSLVVFF